MPRGPGGRGGAGRGCTRRSSGWRARRGSRAWCPWLHRRLWAHSGATEPGAGDQGRWAGLEEQTRASSVNLGFWILDLPLSETRNLANKKASAGEALLLPVVSGQILPIRGWVGHRALAGCRVGLRASSLATTL